MEEDKIHQFLMGLDDEPYSTVRSQILAMESLPSIEKIFNIVQQEENHRIATANLDTRPENMAVFATSHISRLGYLRREQLSCKRCGKVGHDETTCYELGGYLARWSSRGGRGGRNKGRGGRGGGQTHGGSGRGKEVVYQVHAYVKTQPKAVAESMR